MSKFIFSKKMAKLLIQNRTLRSSVILIVLLLIMTIILLAIGMSYSKKIKMNEAQIQDAKAQLIQLQEIVTADEDGNAKKISGRNFAPYEEIVPFIGLLESLFAIIDPKSEISVKNEESEIYINRYADYDVQLRPTGKMDLFLKALDELHKSKYLTKIVSFNINYAPKEEGKPNEIQDVDLTIRLYFE